MGFPLSLSEAFQQRNTRASIEGFSRLDKSKIFAIDQIIDLWFTGMGFGNPYGEAWHPDMLTEFSSKLYNELGVEVIALSDTVGNATEDVITSAFKATISELPKVEFGAHLHLKLNDGVGKIDAAFKVAANVLMEQLEV